MTQQSLFFLSMAFVGFYSSRWMLRLAPWQNELPLKTLLATALAVGLLLAPWLGWQPAGGWLLAALIFIPLYTLGPLAVTALAYNRRFGIAAALSPILYWTDEGRFALQRLLAQVALQRGDAERALALLADRPEDDLLRIQAYALAERWEEVLALEPPREGDNAFLARAARVQAQLALGERRLAEAELADMENKWEQQGQGPLGYRSITLSKARLSAAEGNFEATRAHLREPLPGVPPYLMFGILAQAAERSGRLEPALQLYTQAYSHAPPAQRGKYAAKLQAHGQPLPEVMEPSHTKTWGTYGLFVVILAAFGVQLWLERAYGPNAGLGVAGFLLNFPQIPDSDVLWRYLSYAFVHANLVHIGFNLWVLFDIGRLFERRRNWGNLLASFVIGTAMGAYFTVLAQGGQQIALVGASGGILGIAGALLADVLRSRDPRDRLLTRSLLQWMGLIVLLSVAIPNVSLWGHVGGVIGGLLWGFVRQGLPKSRPLDNAAGAVSIVLLGYAVFKAAQWGLQYL